MKQELSYSQEEIYNALRLYALYNSQERVAKETNIPRGTINGWLLKEENKQIVSDIRHENLLTFKEDTASIINDCIELLQRDLNDAKMGKKDLKPTELTTILGTLYDKRAIEKGGNTSNVVNIAIQLNGNGLPESILKDV